MLTAATLAVIAVHVLLARRAPVWAGAVVPTLWVVAVIAMVAHGDVRTGRSYLACAAGLVMLLWLWGSEHQRRLGRKKVDGGHLVARREP